MREGATPLRELALQIGLRRAGLAGLCVAGAVLLLRFRVGSAWLVAGGALAGGLRVALG